MPPKRECDLSGTGTTLLPTTSASGGAISGPRDCPGTTCLKAQPACTEVPGPGFPGKTAELSAAAWPNKQQPTNAQCWPRDANGFPVHCSPQQVSILEDSASGWAGKCRGLQQVFPPAGQSCEMACLTNVLCSVWQQLNYTNPHQCWHGSFGTTCYDNREGFYPTRSQRVMHGTVRVLFDLTGRHVEGLSRMFGNTIKSGTSGRNSGNIVGMEAAMHCKLYCYGNLGCEYWLFSNLTGCWVEDKAGGRVSYPFIDDPNVSSTTAAGANDIIAGEMIQHYCGDDSASCGLVPTPAPVQYIGGTTPIQSAKVNDGYFLGLPAKMWTVILIILGVVALLGVIACIYLSNRKGRYGGGSSYRMTGDEGYYSSESGYYE